MYHRTHCRLPFHHPTLYHCPNLFHATPLQHPHLVLPLQL